MSTNPTSSPFGHFGGAEPIPFGLLTQSPGRRSDDSINSSRIIMNHSTDAHLAEQNARCPVCKMSQESGILEQNSFNYPAEWRPPMLAGVIRMKI